MELSGIGRGTASRNPSAFPRLLRLISRALVIRRHRQTLRRLDPHLLRDIGLTAEQAETEARRPVWDVPGHWRD